jgi:uncharacterized membrane protein
MEIIFKTILQFYEVITVSVSAGLFVWIKKRKSEHEPLAVVSFFLLMFNYYIIEHLSRYTGDSMLPPIGRGNSEMLSFVVALIGAIVGSIALLKIRKSKKKGIVFAAIGTTLNGTVAAIGVGIFIYFMHSMSGF